MGIANIPAKRLTTYRNVRIDEELDAGFAALIRNLQEFTMTGEVEAGIRMVGSVRRLAESSHKRNRRLIIPHLAAILMSGGLRRDAIALVRQHPVSKG